jgi:ankyrin repeat protein
MVAAGNGNCEMISALIEYGAKVNLQDSLGQAINE